MGNLNMRLFRTELTQSPEMRHMFRDVQMDTDELIREVLTHVRRDLLRFLTGYTNVRRPGDYRAQFGPLFAGRKAPDRDRVEWGQFAKWWNLARPAHPGGWADITGRLMNGYRSVVLQNGPADYTMTLTNIAVDDKGHEYAPYLEAKAGFFVVSGVFAPGGKVMSEVTRVFNFLSRTPRGKLNKTITSTPLASPAEGVQTTGGPL